MLPTQSPAPTRASSQRSTSTSELAVSLSFPLLSSHLICPSAVPSIITLLHPLPLQSLTPPPTEFFVIRNAGGRAADAMRSLAFFDQALHLSAVLFVHHTDCGMTHVSDAEIRAGLKKRDPEHADDIEAASFGEIAGADHEKSLREDVEVVKGSKWFEEGLIVKGLLFDLVGDGGVREIVG